MKAHADLKKLITSKNIQSFVKDLCLHAYPWTERIPVEYLEYKIFEEFRLREDTGEKTQARRHAWGLTRSCNSFRMLYCLSSQDIEL